MKQIFGLFALLLGVCAANAQTADTVKYAAGNDLYRGITRKLPYRQMVTPYGVEVTFAKTVHIIFPAAVRYVDLGSNHIIAGKADGAENVIRVKATTEAFRAKRTSPSFARTAVSFRSTPNTPVNRKCSISK